MYYEVLGRAPLSVEVDGWARLVQAGTSLGTVAGDFVASQEAESNVVTLDYEQFLGRIPAAGEVDFWVGVVAGSSDPGTILNANILGSPEAYADRS